MALSGRLYRSVTFKPSLKFPCPSFQQKISSCLTSRQQFPFLRSREASNLSCPSKSSTVEEAFEPKYGLPIVREKVSYGQLLKDIRELEVKEIHWFTQKNVLNFEGVCLVEYHDGTIKQSVVPARDLTIPCAMTANQVKGSVLSSVPINAELNPVSPVSERFLSILAKIFPVISLIIVYIAVQYMNWLKGDYGDRLRMKAKERQDEQKQKQEIEDENIKSEAENLADMGMSVKEIVAKLRESRIPFELYHIKKLVDKAQARRKKAEEEERIRKQQEAENKLVTNSKGVKDKQNEDLDLQKKRKALGRNSDDQAAKMLTLNTLQVVRPRKKERDIYEKEASQRKMKQLIRKMRSRGMKLQYTEDDRVYFDDVAGVGNAKFEVMEVVDFFINSSRFRQSGARIPRGVLLCGPPGCGKTMLARAVAGEAGVNFLCVNASEFVEMFIGVGASRVRNLFTEARNNAPCIVFIDEIDAVGRIRGGASGNDERDQTVNQLLSEMDGFNRKDADIIVMAATNRKDVLDRALIRPGRFDRIIHVGLPDLEGRVEILDTYLGRINLEGDIDVREIAFETRRFSGAALANLVNTACIFAGRAGHSGLRHEDLLKALEYEKLGPSRPAYSDGRQERLAVHEASTALVASLMPSIEPIVYITIIPREKHPMGQTVLKVNGDRELTQQFTQRYLSEQLLMILASRAGEEICYGKDEMSTINQRKIVMARRIVQKLLVTDNLELIPGIGHRMTFAPRQVGRIRKQIGVPWSTSQAHEVVDTAMERRLNSAYEESKQILQRNEVALKTLIKALMEKNMLTGEEVREIIETHCNREDLERRNVERCDFM